MLHEHLPLALIAPCIIFERARETEGETANERESDRARKRAREREREIKTQRKPRQFNFSWSRTPQILVP